MVPSSHNNDYVAEDVDIGSERAEHPATNFEIPIQGSKDQLVESSTEGSESTSHSEDEESFYDFVSERSFHSEEDTGEPIEISAYDYTVDKLYEQL